MIVEEEEEKTLKEIEEEVRGACVETLKEYGIEEVEINFDYPMSKKTRRWLLIGKLFFVGLVVIVFSLVLKFWVFA